MKELLPIRAGPTLLKRVAALIGCLEDLRSRFKEAVVRIAGRSIANSVSDLLRSLLGAVAENPASEDPCYQIGTNDNWQDDEDPPPDSEISVHLAERHELTTAAGYVPVILSWLALLLSWVTTLFA